MRTRYVKRCENPDLFVVNKKMGPCLPSLAVAVKLFKTFYVFRCKAIRSLCKAGDCRIVQHDKRRPPGIPVEFMTVSIKRGGNIIITYNSFPGHVMGFLGEC